jgi:glycosyltransferase involved in cell wall biosynthesis
VEVGDIAGRRLADRAAARRRLGIAVDGPPLFVLPGVLKAAKLVTETLRAAAPLLAGGQARLLLAGRVLDEALAAQATTAGAIVLRDPANDAYEDAIVAADAVLCLRGDSVGESNGPLLDAIGAARASLVTAVGSAPEIAGAAALVVDADVAGIRAGLEALLHGEHRRALARAALDRATELTWAATARRYAELLTEVADA